MSEELTQEKEITKLEKSLKNKNQFDFVLEMRELNVDQLDKKMLDLAKYKEELQNTKNSDEKLIEAKAIAKELERPYREDKKMNEVKRRFVSLIMKEKGYE